MARGPHYRVKLRRIREGKTDYWKRVALLKSEKPRIVVRRTSNMITVQFIVFDPRGDRVIAQANSKDLVRLGWKAHPANLPAAYLVGYLAAKRAIEKGIRDAVLDIGFQTPVHGSAPFAALKGALDAGVNVPHSEEALPPEERIRGEHIAAYAKLLKSSQPDRYQRQFSKYIERGLEPENIVSHFEDILAKVKA